MRILLPATLFAGVTALTSVSAVWAQTDEVIGAESSEPFASNMVEDSLAQIHGVIELSDVRPDDWTFQAFRSLVERYGCLQGYPDQTYGGDRALSRYEFAAGLNACLEMIQAELDRQGLDDESLAAIAQLQRIFRAELLALESRIGSLNNRVESLIDQQFSTTSKLFGQVVVGVQGRTENNADFFPVDGDPDLADPGTRVNLMTNAQFSLITALAEDSLLLVGLQAGTGSTAPRLNNDVRLSFEGDTNGDFQLSDLTLRQRLSDRFALIVGPEGVSPVNVFRGANRVESAGDGPLSAFAQRNPIISIGAGSGGLGFDWQISSKLALQGVYATTFPGNVDFGGLFGGEAGAIVLGTQLNVAPTEYIDFAFNYLYAYTPAVSFGGSLGTGIGDDQVTVNAALNTHAIGLTASWRVTPGVTLGGWGGYTTSRIPDTSGNVETVNWMGFVNFPDLFKEGNLGALYVGQPPRITASDLPTGQNIPDLLAGGIGASGGQPGSTLHLEAFYRYRLSDQISLTPGVIVILDPAHTPGSETIAIGALRTTFRF